VAIVDVSGESVDARLRLADAGIAAGPLVDLVSGDDVPVDRGEVALRLRPYQVVWLRGKAA
jgi:hypothetical protein